MIEGKKVFITGGGGFIGSSLAEPLLEKNEIIIFDNFSRDSLQHKSYKNHPNLTVIEGDVLDDEHVLDAIQGAELVVHCAAIAGIDTVENRNMERRDSQRSQRRHSLLDLGDCFDHRTFRTRRRLGLRSGRHHQTQTSHRRHS